MRKAQKVNVILSYTIKIFQTGLKHVKFLSNTSVKIALTSRKLLKKLHSKTWLTQNQHRSESLSNYCKLQFLFCTLLVKPVNFSTSWTSRLLSPGIWIKWSLLLNYGGLVGQKTFLPNPHQKGKNFSFSPVELINLIRFSSLTFSLSEHTACFTASCRLFQFIIGIIIIVNSGAL